MWWLISWIFQFVGGIACSYIFINGIDLCIRLIIFWYRFGYHNIKTLDWQDWLEMLISPPDSFADFAYPPRWCWTKFPKKKLSKPTIKPK
jgi:hypothetical protein